MGTRPHVLLIYGGRSAEHAVSVVSARSIFDALRSEPWDLTLVCIEAEGTWQLTGYFEGSRGTAQFPEAHISLGRIVLAHGGRIIPLDGQEAPRRRVDVAFPVLHGTNGEDGTIQGLLTLYDVPCVGAGVLASAAGMDKVCTKRLLREADIPVVDFRVARQNDVRRPDYDSCVRALGHPLFVKPANTGSSVGISKVRRRSEFDEALDHAFLFDSTVVVESGIDGREIECAVLGPAPVRVSVCGEIVTSHDFYTYEAKYEDESGTQLIVPAELSEAESDQIRSMARRTCEALNCESMARVDFFLSSGGNIYVNEINTIPGFTSVSMYPRLWAHTGITFPRLVDELLSEAITRHDRMRNLHRTR
ncbi:MAG: D-alanine--D-alanine ligase [Bacteroidota bacterium]|nr:D-alanine--D-alanine ligase [Bacteroidota bacterium]